MVGRPEVAASLKAWRYGGDAPLSGVRSRAVPTITAAAPASRTAATSPGRRDPPGGHDRPVDDRPDPAHQVGQLDGVGLRSGVRVAEWPPARQPCRATASIPMSAARAASSALVTDCTTDAAGPP